MGFRLSTRHRVAVPVTVQSFLIADYPLAYKIGVATPMLELARWYRSITTFSQVGGWAYFADCRGKRRKEMQGLDVRGCGAKLDDSPIRLGAPWK